MQNNFELPIFILPGTSRRDAIWTDTIHIGAMALLLLSAVPWLWKIFLLVFVLISYRSTISDFYKQSRPDSIKQVFCNELDEWWLTFADGRVRQGRLLCPYFVHARLVILGFKTGPAFWQRRHVILTQETVNPDSLRRLRVRLRLPLRSMAEKPEQE